MPADIAHLNEENRKKLKRMQLFTQTEGNEQARARQIDVLTRSQAAGVGGGVGPIGGLGGLLAGKANALNKTGGPSSTANVSATQPEIDLKSMFNLSAIKKIGKDLSIESADSKDEKIAKLQAYKEELTKISAGTDETEIKQAVDYLKIVNFLIKELKKKTINPQIIDLLTKRGSTMGISVSVITEDSLLEEIQNLETQITKLRLDLAELEMSKVGLVEGDKKLEAIQRQTISKQNAIRTKSEAVSEKTKERRLLIAKTKEESAKSLSSLASSPRIEASVSSASPVVDSKEVLVPVDSTAKLDAALMIRVEPPPPIAVHSSKSVDLSSAAVVVGPSPIIKSAMASGPALAPPEKSLRLGGTGSILGDIRTATSGGALRKSITRGIAANIKHMRLEELKELKIEVEGELAKLSLQIERLRLEIQNLIVAKQSAMDDTEKEKIEKKVLSKTKLLEGKEIAIKEKEGTISEINNQIPIAEILQRRAMLDDGEDSSSDSDEDPDDWD